ncbi:MAG: carboxylesterase family protein [Gammaproteobacteria bacterium]|jgi:para-nitrobenzyl esterase|nr:carboxylesterase family protein [Gammaproteobacteria bacterium]
MQRVLLLLPLLLPLLLGLLLGGCAWLSPPPQVVTEQGVLSGGRAGAVAFFKGVPYAAAPVGALRWRPPHAAPAWSGVRAARRYAPNCAQPVSAVAGFVQQPMSEDCLTLNVWAPEQPGSEPLPVMVWIHGGGYSLGSGNRARSNSPALAAEGVVLVTVNYRLSVFGFLAHPAARVVHPDDDYANYGLQDVVMALDWVQRNIAAFGGDPGRVTVFGESAGAGIVNALLVAPPAAGKFHRAISQSASVGLAPEPYPNRRAGFLPPAERQGEAFAAGLGVTPAMTPGEVMARLRSASTAQVLSLVSDRDRYTPVIDGRFLPDQIGTLLAAGRQQAVPYLTGGNSWEASLGRDIGGGFAPAAAARLVPAALRPALYPGLEGDALDDAIFGDLVVLAGSRYVAEQMAAAGAPVYRYFLSYVPTARRGRQPGVAHEDDIAFVMQTLDAEPDLARLSVGDRERSQLMSRYWVQFARTGDPNGGGRPPWPAYTPAQPAVLEIGDTLSLRQEPFRDRLDFHIASGLRLLERARSAARAQP